MKLLKKIVSVCLSLSMFLLNVLPSLAEGCYQSNDKVLVHANNEIVISFVDSFNANKSSVGDIIKFKLDMAFRDDEGDFLPANTIFYGKVDSLTKSKIGFRKAKANISITSMCLPDGREFQICASPEKSTITSSTGANIAKGVATSTVAAGVCIVGAVVVAIECLSVGGLILAPYTGAAVGVALATTSKGINCKIPAGTKISIKFDRPLNISGDM